MLDMLKFCHVDVYSLSFIIDNAIMALISWQLNQSLRLS